MDCFFLRRFSLVNFLFTCFSLLSFPAFSATATFSFVEFNIAFVLGLSLPVLVIAALMKPVIKIKWRFPAIITVALIGMLYAIAYLQTTQIQVLLSCGIVFLALLYLWPLSKSNAKELASKKKNTLIIKYTSLSIYGVSGCAVLFIVSLWFMPKIDAYLVWAACASGILLFAGFQIVMLAKDNKVKVHRFVLQWLVSLTFVIAMYLWLNAKLEIHWLVVTCVLSYLVVLINGSWLLVQRVLAVLPVSKEHEKISFDDLFSFTHDPATNLPSYQQAIKKLELMVKSNNDKQYAAIVFKPINFQQVNTVLGHHNSDILLLQLAYCLQQQVVENSALVNFDVDQQPIRLARLHGLHFLVVVDLSASKYTDKIVIDELCQQLSSAVPEAMSFKSFSLNFELAFGAAIIGEHGKNVTEVIAFAGDALLSAETNNLKLTYFDSSSILYTEQQLALMEKLKSDIVDDNLYWYLQPQIALSDRAIKGFELKVHWYHDEKPLELHEFVELAEHSGEVYLFTKQMIKQAFKVLFKLNKLGIHKPVSIKLSSKDLLESDLIDYIEIQMAKYNIAANYLLVELTEKVIAQSGNKVNRIISQLKSLDIGIVIDDFSGSYESLRYMRKMSFDQVKIDCSQLVNSDENFADKAIINALVNLTRTMQIPLVGSKIDSNVIEKAFSSMGGEIAQGLAVQKGVVPDEVEIWLNKWFEQYPNAKPFK